MYRWLFCSQKCLSDADQYLMISLSFATFIIQLSSIFCCFMRLKLQSSCIEVCSSEFLSVCVFCLSLFSPFESLPLQTKWASWAFWCWKEKCDAFCVSVCVWKRGWLAKCENALWFAMYRPSRDCHHSSSSHHNPVYNHCRAGAHHYSGPTENYQTLAAAHQALGASGQPHQEVP